MPEPINQPPQQPGFDWSRLFGRARRARRARPGPRLPARIIGAVRAAGPIAQRATAYGFVGYGGYQALSWYINKKNLEQERLFELMLHEQDRLANVKVRAVRLAIEKEKALRRIDEDNAAFLYNLTRPPKGIPPWLLGTGTVTSQIEEGLLAPAAPAVPSPPSVPEKYPMPYPPTAAPGPSAKDKLRAAVAKALKAPLLKGTGTFLQALAIGSVAKQFLPKAPKQIEFPPLPGGEFELPPLTGFQEQQVFLGGELGGVTEFAEEPDTGTAGTECETIDPARTPGQCRQGWFSETPERLMLKEWSRRPCP